MQGQHIEGTSRYNPLYLLKLNRDDITALLKEKSVSCTIPGKLDGKPIELAMYGVPPNVMMKPWFEAQVYGKPPFSMFVPSRSEDALRNYLTEKPFEIRTIYCGLSASAYAKIEIEPR